MNPKIKEYFQKSGKLPSDNPEENPVLEDASPWAKLAAGLGATIAGRSPSEALDYFDKQRELELGRVEQQRRYEQDQARRAEDVAFREQQAAQDEAFRQKQLQMQDAQRRDLAALNRQDRAMAQEAKSAEKVEKKQQAMNEVADRYVNIKDSLGKLKEMVGQYGTQEIFGPQNAQMEQYLTSLATDMAKLADPQSVARPSEVAEFKKMLFEPGFWQRESTVQSILDNFGQMVDQRLKSAYDIRGLEQPQQVQQRMGSQQETKMINGKEYIKVPGGWQLKK